MLCNNRTEGLYFPLSVIYYYNNNIITIPSTLFYHTFPKLFWSSPEPLSLNNSASPEITQPFLLQTPSFSSLPLSLPPCLPACLPASASHNYFHDLIKEIQFLTDRAYSLALALMAKYTGRKKDLNQVGTKLSSEDWHLGLTAAEETNHIDPVSSPDFTVLFEDLDSL